MGKLKHWILMFIFINIIFFSSITTSYAQDEEKREGINVDLEEVLTGYESKVNPMLFTNLLFLQQIGNENHIIIKQEQEGTQLNKNITLQDGIKNSAFITQTGSGLDTQLEQYKSNNLANLYSVGENIRVRARQNGDGNHISSYIENDGGSLRSAVLLQEGNYNKINLSLKGNGFADPSMEQRVAISQFGNAHELNVSRDPFSVPLNITQTAGSGGEGMKVDITNSDFYFPMKQ